jgi:hypothetical protein
LRDSELAWQTVDRVDGESAVTGSAVKRRILVALALAALCGVLAGCVSDMGASTAANPDTGQLRYYGGPKYPMWQSQ